MGQILNSRGHEFPFSGEDPPLFLTHMDERWLPSSSLLPPPPRRQGSAFKAIRDAGATDGKFKLHRAGAASFSPLFFPSDPSTSWPRLIEVSGPPPLPPTYAWSWRLPKRTSTVFFSSSPFSFLSSPSFEELTFGHRSRREDSPSFVFILLRGPFCTGSPTRRRNPPFFSSPLLSRAENKETLFVDVARRRGISHSYSTF